ncbi:MAG: GNAT family N-acetyltransferase [Ignavibacteriaceae bacterium]
MDNFNDIDIKGMHNTISNYKIVDIYYEPCYQFLYENKNGGRFAYFEYNENSKYAFYPFLLNNVNKIGYSLDSNYYDIEGAYGYNGILSNCIEEDFINKFYKAFTEFCKNNNIIAEFTRFHPLLENHIFSQNHMEVVFDRETVALDLRYSFENIWGKQYTSKNRNMVRKAEKLGYSIEIKDNPTHGDILNFIDVYYSSMNKVNAERYYYFSDDYFFNTFKLLKEFVFIFNVKDNSGGIICSAIFFHYKKYFHYHLSGRAEKADNSVNNYLLNEAVKFAQKRKAEVFHFGGGRTNSPEDSLLKFKSNFSKKRLPFYIGKKIHNERVYREVIKQWEEKVKINKSSTNNKLLRYREI